MKKRSYSAFLMILLLAVSSATFSIPVQADTSGYWRDYSTPVTPEDDVYNIQDASQLAWIAEQVNTGNISLYECTIALSNDIDLSGHYWVPIGNQAHPFYGTINGKGKTISNLIIGSQGTPVSSTGYEGLFGYANDSVFSNVILNNVEIYLDSSSIPEGTYTGCLAGYFGGTGAKITGCTAGGSIAVSGGEYSSYAGGLAGSIGDNCSIEASSAAVNITTSGPYSNIGGLAGSSMSGCSISSCSAEGNITGGKYSNIGGLIGYSLSQNISESHAEGNVNGGESSQVGGLIGFAGNYGNIGDIGVYGSYAVGEVEGMDYSNNGGLIGYITYDTGIGNCEIRECYAEGNVSGGDVSINGGLLGNNNASSVHSSYAKGNISSGSESSSGGFAGNNYFSLVDNCYSAGRVPEDASGGSAGGFAGYEGGDNIYCIKNSYWNSKVNVPGISSIGYTDVDSAEDRAEAKTSDQMKEDAFADLLNLSIGTGTTKSWIIISGVNGGYPVLKKVDLCFVTFDKNGGDTDASPSTKQVKQYKEVGALPISPTLEDHLFTGWNTEADGSGEIFTKASIVYANMTVYAQWIISPELISITALEDITEVANGATKTAVGLGLPENVTIKTDSGDMQCNVTWDVASCSYNPDTLMAQTFSIEGIVVLPTGMKNTNGVELTVSIIVTVDAAPAITGISPSGGSSKGGTIITITGTNLVGVTGVTIGGAAATNVTVISSTSVRATTPAGMVGTVDVVAAMPGRSVSGIGLFTYYGPPFIKGIDPNCGPTAGGAVVTITGDYLASATGVTIGGAVATNVTVISDISIRATTPARTAGKKNVTVTTPEGSSTISGLYIYYAVPTISSINPNSGPTAGGTYVDIYGSNLTGPDGILGVTIGGKACTQVGILAPPQPPGIRAKTPAGTAGAADVVVTTPGGSAAKSKGFTYIAKPTVTTQVVSNITATTAIGNGNIISLGAPNPTQYGVVWSKSTNPTVDLTTKTTQGATSATGAFTSNITGLAPNTTYYARAYATNTIGTSYGDQVMFSTALAVTPTGTAALNNGRIKKDAVITLSSEAGAKIYYTVALNGDTPAAPTASTPTYVSNGGAITYPALTYGDVLKIKAIAVVPDKADSEVASISYVVQSKTELKLKGISVSNKEYDGNTNASAVFTGAGLSGIIGTDSIALAGTPGASFLTPAADNGKPLTVSGYSLSGKDAEYYTLNTTLLSTADITKKVLNLSTIIIKDKVYDGNTGAIITGATLTGIVGNDDVTVDYTTTPAVAAFDNAMIGTGKQVSVAGLILGGSDKDNYTLASSSFITTGNIIGLGAVTSPTPSIADGTVIKSGTAVTLTTVGFDGAILYYTIGTAPANPTSADDFIISGGKVTITGKLGEAIILKVYGTEAGYTDSILKTFHYTIQSKVTLTVEGAVAADKEYDGSNAAVVTGGTLTGAIAPGHEVALVTSAVVGQFADKNAGEDKIVTITGYALAGADSSDYELIQPVLTADILKKSVTADNIAIDDKVYDGTMDAIISSISLSWKASGDNVYIKLSSATAVFLNASAGNGKEVTVTGLELAGADSGNYQLTASTAVAAGNIVNSGTVAAPDISPKTDTIYSGTKAALTTATAGAAIYYTMDGSAPSSSSNLYTSPISIEGNPGTVITVKAVAVMDGMADSGITTEEYTIASPGDFIISCEPGDKIVTLSWDAIPNAVVYQVFCGPDYMGDGISVTESVYEYNANGLTNGTLYTFSVNVLDAENLIISSAYATATPRTVPGVPTDVTAEAGNGQAAISFNAPADDGGSEITGYTVICSPGSKIASGAGSPVIVTGLTNGIEYTFTIRALNTAGSSAKSLPSNAVIPLAPSGEGQDRDNEREESPPPLPSKKPASVLISVSVNGEAQNAGIVTAATDREQTAATVTFDDRKLSEMLKAEGNNTTFSVSVSGSFDRVIGVLSGQAVKDLGVKEAVLEIKTDNVSYTIPASEIDVDVVSAEMGAQVALKDIKVSISIAKPTADTVKIIEDTASKNNYNIIVKPVEFEITCTNGDKTVNVSRFGGYVERMVAIPGRIDPSKITTAILLNKDGSFSHIPTTITVIEGKYYAKIRSLTNSTYAVIQNSKTIAEPENHWAREAMEDLASRLILEGTDKESFAPDREITRGEFSSIIVKGLGLMRSGTGKDVYDDIKKTDWYYDAVYIASEYGLINGTGNGKFEPDIKITREEAMLIIARAMAIAGMNTDINEAETEKLLEKFKDSIKIKGFAKESSAVCIKNGIIKGIGDEIKPQDNITRAEVAEMVRRLLQKAGLI